MDEDLPEDVIEYAAAIEYAVRAFGENGWSLVPVMATGGWELWGSTAPGDWSTWQRIAPPEVDVLIRLPSGEAVTRPL